MLLQLYDNILSHQTVVDCKQTGDEKFETEDMRKQLVKYLSLSNQTDFILVVCVVTFFDCLPLT